jgi:cation diffusion facilitator CzcD-associated flavoprotein CzcO
LPIASVVVVGGGASGLSAAAALMRRGMETVVLEQDNAIGSVWARRYDRLHLHTMREYSGLAHFPIPKRYPRYLSRDQVVAYLREYAQQCRLRVMTGVTVTRIAPSADGWRIETGKGEPWQARVAVIATGQYREPVVPEWPGRESYRGSLSHSITYVNAAPYAGLRVLVVGAGNSGAEIATDLAEGGAAMVALSVRTPPPIVLRDPFGMPVQRTSILLSLLPAAIANRIGATTARLTVGDLSRYGMPRATFNPYTRKHVPLIDVGFVSALKRGEVTIRPAVDALTPDGARFADGTHEAFDAIVAATGFTTGLASLLDVDGVLDETGEPKVASGEPGAAPGLFFIGFTHTLRGHLFEARRTSHCLARNVAQYLGERR